jgi:hypothetical protein
MATDRKVLEQRIAQRAHELWLEEGQPPGREQEFRARARQIEEAAPETDPGTGHVLQPKPR